MPEGYFKKVRNIRPEKPIFSPPICDRLWLKHHRCARHILAGGVEKNSNRGGRKMACPGGGRGGSGGWRPPGEPRKGGRGEASGTPCDHDLALALTIANL